MKTLNFTAVYSEINHVTNIEKTDTCNIYTDYFTKKVSLFYVENNINIFIDTIDVVYTNYAQYTDLCLKYVLDFLGKKVTDFDTISPTTVLH